MKYMPDAIQLANDNVCGLSCPYCASVIPGVPRNHMDLKTFKTYFDRVRDFGIKNIQLTPCCGDPLNDPDIAEKVNYIGKDAIVRMTTNLLALEEGIAANLFASNNLELGISVYGENAKQFKEMTNRDKFGLFINKLELLLKEMGKIKDRQLLVFIFRFLTEKCNPAILHEEEGDTELTQLPDGALFHPVYRVIALLERSHHGVGCITRLSNNNMNRVTSSSIKPIQKDIAGTKVSGLKESSRIDYPRPYVWGDGDVTMCAMDYNKNMVIGNMNEMSLPEMFGAGSLWEEILDERKNGLFRSVCKHCGYEETGDPIKPYMGGNPNCF